ncbi:unnamed protein product [Rotaria socialis]|uniref:Peptidase C14 caspase domain-containing protein n=1 Tax=Rotaria socialis TaxID=392032 RepID=A0A819A2T1_9BILA|nr:unnamed protein product [Rotaria socialis]
MVGVAYNISWQSSCLFVLGTEKVCIHDFNGRIDEYVWPSKEVFTAFKQRGCFICLYSAHSLLLYDYVYSEKCRLQLDAEEFVHIDLIRLGGNDVLLVCSRDSKSIDLWGFYDGVPKKKYPFERFDECIVECSTLITYSGTLIKITLKNGRIHYLHSNKGSFQTVATLNKKPGKQSILLNFTTDVYYSEGHSYIDLYHFNGAASSESNPFQRISNLPHVGNRCSRISCRKTSSMQNIDDALIWFTSKYAVIVDFYCSHIVIPGEYTGICEIHVSLYDFSNLFGNFICCLKKDKTGINIFEWRCDKGVHMYRLLAFLELDQKIFNCVCSIDWYSGIAVYCALEDGELRRYNATMMASLPDRPAPFSKSPILKEQISHLQIQDKILLTLDESKRTLKLFTFSNCISFLMKLCISNGISQYAVVSSYVLVMDSEDTLCIYSICTTPELLFKTTKFQHNFFRVHSSGSSFLIIDSNMRQLLHIDTKLPLTLNNVADLKITCRSLLSATVPERSILYILSDDQSTLTIWDSEKNTIKYHLIHLEKTIKVQKLYALSSALVFHDSDQRVHLWYIDADKTTITLERTNHLEVKSTRLVLFHQTVKKLIIYDVDKKLCGKIQVESPCDAFCFTTDEKYLFVISHDESMLQMYEVDTGKMLEKLFIENMSPLIQATNDHLFLFCNNKLLLMSITGRSSLNRDTKVSPAMCPLFEEQYWLWTHKDKPWTIMASETLPSLESSGVKRALLIGINTYKKGSQLQYCINNAQNCGTKLRDVGFHVTIGIDMNYEEMCTMIEDWVCKICPGDQALAFFSGHGTHFDDQNFLIPVDNDQLTSPTMFELRSINVHATLEKMMARHPSAAIFLLDCCFSYVIPNEAASKGVFDCGGLSSMIEVDDSLVVFACDANKTIPDRSTNNQNSIFTAHLLEHIAKPNLTIEEIMNLVCSGVMNETNGDQCPYQASSLYRRKIDLNHRNDTGKSLLPKRK